jgi:hypothetical protein
MRLRHAVQTETVREFVATLRAIRADAPIFTDAELRFALEYGLSHELFVSNLIEFDSPTSLQLSSLSITCAIGPILLLKG